MKDIDILLLGGLVFSVVVGLVIADVEQKQKNQNQDFNPIIYNESDINPENLALNNSIYNSTQITFYNASNHYIVLVDSNGETVTLNLTGIQIQYVGGQINASEGILYIGNNTFILR